MCTKCDVYAALQKFIDVHVHALSVHKAILEGRHFISISQMRNLKL